MENTINLVRESLSKQRIIWAYPIAQKLHDYSYILVIEWILECLQIYLANFEYGTLLYLSFYIQKIDNFEKDFSASDCNDISKKIWYLPGRDDLQTSLSRLWRAMGAFKNGEDKDGLIESSFSVELLLPDLSDSFLLDRYLETALAIYRDRTHKH